MNKLKHNIIVFLLLTMNISLYAQDNAGPSDEADPSAEAIDSPTETLNSTCSTQKQQIMDLQKSIFELPEDENQQNLIDLLSDRDEARAKKALVEGLLDIWDNYYNYLEANEELAASSESYNNISHAVQNLNNIQAFINDNTESVARYHLVSEAFSQFDINEFEGKSKSEIFNYIKSSMQSSCQDTAKANALGYCQVASQDPSFWSNISTAQSGPSNPQTSSEVIHKFIEVTASSANDNGAVIEWMNNLSTMFVDKENINADLLADENLSTLVSELIDQSKDQCRQQVLIEARAQEEIDCMDQSEFLSNNPTMQKIRERLSLNSNINSNSINTLQDVVDSYIANAQATSDAHHENTGGIFDVFKQLTEHRDAISAGTAQLNDSIKADSQRAKEEFQNHASAKIACLGHELKALKTSSELYSQYANDINEMSDNMGTNAANTLKSLFGDDVPENFFITTADRELRINPDQFQSFLNDEKFSKQALQDQLTQARPEYDGKSIDQYLAQLDEQINAIKDSNRFKQYSEFKRFAWQEFEKDCVETTSSSVAKIVENQHCMEDIESEVDELLKVGEDFIAYQETREHDAQINNLQDQCDGIFNRDPALYELVSNLCIKVTRAQRESFDNERDRIIRNNRRNDNPGTVHRYYDDDGNQTGSYQTKTWGQIAPIAMAQGFLASGFLPVWSQTPVWQSYALTNTIMGQQQKTHDAFMNARHQSILNTLQCTGAFNCYMPTTITPGVSPTLGQSGFQF